jgi:hypothetical protein
MLRNDEKRENDVIANKRKSCTANDTHNVYGMNVFMGYILSAFDYLMYVYDNAWQRWLQIFRNRDFSEFWVQQLEAHTRSFPQRP